MVVLNLLAVSTALISILPRFVHADSNADASTDASADADLKRRPLGPGKESHQVVNDTTTTVWPYQKFQSAPFNPPELQISSNGEPLAPGLLLFTPENLQPQSPGTKDVAPLIMTDKGQLVWESPTAGSVTNFRAVKYKGQDILTYWSGVASLGANVGHGYGNVTLLDSSYQAIAVVCPQFGLVTPGNIKYQCEGDFHESFITDRDTLIVSAYNATPTDLSAVGGPKNGWVYDSLVYELDIASGKVLFKWSSLEHVPVTNSKWPLNGAGQNQSVPWDYFHINSVVNVGPGYYLVNSRHCWQTRLVDKKGSVVWMIQGDNGGDFVTLPASGQFVSLSEHHEHRDVTDFVTRHGNTMSDLRKITTTQMHQAST